MLTASYSSPDWAPQNQIANLVIYLVFPESSQTIKKMGSHQRFFSKGNFKHPKLGTVTLPYCLIVNIVSLTSSEIVWANDVTAKTADPHVLNMWALANDTFRK